MTFPGFTRDQRNPDREAETRIQRARVGSHAFHPLERGKHFVGNHVELFFHDLRGVKNLGLVVWACNPSTWEAQVGES